ncbi:hypothetical protein FSPOR_4339 [Fusarium sporotrichioides]|uniref:Uncharacterized protein n=1 Tax=Fusarium sporotrichioides TaxID=5514 RepID=A0A395SCZ9_FUSSP|nr:hypothetical protein FSPOR_4339 [Fusarium sporotrichioides]
MRLISEYFDDFRDIVCLLYHELLPVEGWSRGLFIQIHSQPTQKVWTPGIASGLRKWPDHRIFDDIILLVTSIPIATTLKDLLNPLTLIAYANESINDIRYLSLHDLGFVPGLCHPSYAPYGATNIITSENDEEIGKRAGIFSGEFLSAFKGYHTLTAALASLQRASANTELKP